MNLFARFSAFFHRPRPMDNITPRAQQTLALARRVAASHKLDEVDIDHVLIGLLWLNEGLATQALKSLGIDATALKSELDRSIQNGASSLEAINLPYNRSIKLCLALGVQEAEKTRHAYFGTDHILLGLIRYGKGAAHEALIARGITFATIKHQLLKLREEEIKKAPNQSPETTTMAVTDAAAQPPRQP